MNITSLIENSANALTAAKPYICNLLGAARLEEVEAVVTAAAIVALTYACKNVVQWTNQQLRFWSTQGNFDALISSGTNAWAFSNGLRTLHAADPALVTPENRAALIASGANASPVAIGLRTLHAADPALVTPENRAALIASGANAEAVADGLESLHVANPALVTPENSAALIASGANALWVAFGLYSLHRGDPALLTPENRAALIASGANAARVAYGLITLRNANPALVNQGNFNALITSGANIWEVCKGLQSLHAADLLTQANFNLLFDLNEDSEIEPILLTEGNFNLLFPIEEHPEWPILYGHNQQDQMMLPARELPAPLNQESFMEFRDLFMAAKYNPSSQPARAARERFEIAADRLD